MQDIEDTHYNTIMRRRETHTHKHKEVDHTKRSMKVSLENDRLLLLQNRGRSNVTMRISCYRSATFCLFKEVLRPMDMFQLKYLSKTVFPNTSSMEKSLKYFICQRIPTYENFYRPESEEAACIARRLLGITNSRKKFLPYFEGYLELLAVFQDFHAHFSTIPRGKPEIFCGTMVGNHRSTMSRL